MAKWINKHPAIVFLVLMLFVILAGGGAEILDYPPRSTHIFRQSDCLAYTKTYYQYHTGLFAPAGYNLLGKDGRVVSEFPILYYISAWLCRLFGFHYWLIRGLTMLCYLAGLYYLFLCTRMWIKNGILAIVPVVILASTPYYFYYGLNYLPNVPAISLSFAGLYYMLRYSQSAARAQLVAATILFILAVLLKPTDGGLIWAAYLASLMAGSRRTKAHSIRAWLLSASLVAAAALAWYLFVRHYNSTYGNNINLQGLYPIWDCSWNDVSYTFRYRFFTDGRDCLQHGVLFLLLLVFMAVFIINWRSLDHFLRRFTAWLCGGAFVYTILWYRAFAIHDYYLLLYVVPVVFIVITVLAFLWQSVLPAVSKQMGLTGSVILLVVCILSIYYNQDVELVRYKDANVGFDHILEIYESAPYIRKMGVQPTDIILSVPDGSPNITLAAYGNRGYTSDLFGKNNYTVKYCREHGAKYMIISNKDCIADTAYAPYTHKLVGSYKGVYVYDIR